MRHISILLLILSGCSSEGSGDAGPGVVPPAPAGPPGATHDADRQDSGDAETINGSSGAADNNERGDAVSPGESAASARSAGARRGLPAGALRVEPSVIVDGSGFEAPMAAATLFLPAGWTARGGVVWGRQHMCVNGYNFDWSAASPDGLSRIAIIPQEKWEWNNIGAGPSNPGCSLAQCTSVEQYLRNLLSRLAPAARAVHFSRRPDLEKEYATLNQVSPMPLGESRAWVESGEVRYDWQDDNGRAMKGSLAAVAVFNLLRTQSLGGVMEAFTGAVFPGYAASAPAGTFEPAFFEAIRRSIKIDPRWQARISGHNNAIARTALEETRKRGAIISKTNDEIARIRQEAWTSYQESSDRRVREFCEVIKGVETYDDTNAPGGRVELSSQYSHAWRLGNGSYVLTDDPSFEPWRDLGEEGTKLEATR